MSQFLIALIGVILAVNLAYTVWSYFSLKRLAGEAQLRKLEDRYLLEQIVHARTSFNLIYAMIGVVTFVIAFFGFNLESNVTDEVTREISRAAQVDLEGLRNKADSISQMQISARQDAMQVAKTKSQIGALYENMRRSPQKLFVIQSLPVNVEGQKYRFSDLKPVDGTILPKFSQPPVLFWQAYDNELSIGTGINATTEGLTINPAKVPCFIDIWIYAR